MQIYSSYHSCLHPLSPARSEKNETFINYIQKEQEGKKEVECSVIYSSDGIKERIPGP